jgi:peptidoglycan/LPS O-acetylase OafA/YrhL
LNAYRSVPTFHQPHPFPIQVLLAAGIVAVVLASSTITYYFVESPMQKTGHKLARFLQARFGPDTIPAPDAIQASDAIPAPDAIQAAPPAPAEVQPGR